jgi:hypothetical protein
MKRFTSQPINSDDAATLSSVGARSSGASTFSLTDDGHHVRTPVPHTKKIAASTASLDSAHDGHSLSGIVDVILEVGQQRNALIAELRAALQSGNDGDALILARRLCGL